MSAGPVMLCLVGVWVVLQVTTKNGAIANWLAKGGL